MRIATKQEVIKQSNTNWTSMSKENVCNSLKKIKNFSKFAEYTNWPFIIQLRKWSNEYTSHSHTLI